MSGRLSVVGVGPGRGDWCTPAVHQRLAEATDLVGYDRYLELVDDVVDGRLNGRRHASGNRVEADRARFALELAEEGRDVVVVSSGDPGVFAMAGAVLEQLDLHPDRWRHLELDVQPGITAAQALACRVGAPLGHDFCVLSLSDVRKPWAIIERRLDAAAGADFVLALYNPRSRHRPEQLGTALAVVGRHRSPDTVVVIGRNVGRTGEQITITSLGAVDPASVDMSCTLLIGSSTTRLLDRGGAARAYTPRSYPETPGRPSNPAEAG